MSDDDLTRAEFNDVINDIAAFFGAPKETRQLDILYDIFKVYPYRQMKRACLFLIEHHDRNFFPSPREIHDALREVAELKTPAPEVPGIGGRAHFVPRCDLCGGVGMSVSDERTGEYEHHVAVYCSCADGRKMRQNHREYMRRQHGRA